MSFWIVAYCKNTVEHVTPDDLRSGIAARLKLLTYLFCPEEEEDPDEVLSRLQIENISKLAGFRTFLLRYRKDGTPIRVDRDDDPRIVQGEIQETIEEFFPANDTPAKARVVQLLGDVRESAAFCLKVHDIEAMGFPLSIAAAAYLVDVAGGGVIRSGSFSWMVPTESEVTIIWEFDA